MYSLVHGMYYLAVRQTSGSSSQHRVNASKVITNLVNIRSIAAHFRPKIDAWSAAHGVTSITPDQVCVYHKQLF